jgi:hypothetical protein
MNSLYNWLHRAKPMAGWSAALLALAFVVSTASAQPPFPVQPNEVLSYQFQPGVDSVSSEGGIIDYSGNNYNGTALSLGLTTMKILPGNPAAPTQSYAMAMAGDDYFPGTGIWVEATTNQLGITNHDFTIMAWVNRNNLHFDYTDQFVVGNAGQETLAGASPNGGHDLQCGFRYNAASASTFDTYFGFWGDDSYVANTPPDQFIGPKSNPTATPWHHFAWRYTLSSGDQDIFLDGVLVNSDPGHAPFWGSSNLLIGRAAPGNGIASSLNGAFGGLIEHPRVFNAAVSNANIAAAAKYQY